MSESDRPTILLTNDDGIDAPGLRALHDELSEIGSVTVVAPATNQSAVGRSLTYGRTAGDDEPAIGFEDAQFTSPVPHADHELGYAVDGTPCDCVIVGLGALDPEPDVVVAGCNPGANLGAYVLSRSGTVSAAMEAAFLGTPSIAVSMDRLEYEPELAPDAFDEPATVTADLVEYALDTDVFDRVDYCNVNTPAPHRETTGVELTRPSTVYEMDGSFENGEFRLHNRLWEQMAEGSIPDEPGTDRRAILEGRISISPLSVPYRSTSHESLERFVGEYDP
ncbi:5'/3'-nucleotidase SurE [Halosolutus gelatinilyticus]|uniref:5'/3'-nucleotidase SurE n=1 Tax=Halosolutus gelatinilyticus TaxID=2931975 RepID=UPI001FF3D8FF|nr:5'/3'-nucleotidase SurE [Halosolutus gelatinilyticus]